MGFAEFTAEVFAPAAAFVKAAFPAMREMSATVPVWQKGVAQLQNFRYETFARDGYMNNPLVYACIKELMSSAAEPRMQTRSSPTAEWKHAGPIIELLERPNPWQDRYAFWQTVIMHRSIAGNAYALKVRSGSGRVVELGLLRPDRIRIVPGGSFISHYEYHVGDGQIYDIPVEDIVHYKEPHPLSDFYGMPPMMAISGQIDVDTFMTNFVKSAFETGGMPGAVLSVKQKVSNEDKEAIRNRFRNTYGGPGGWHELLILDNAEASYTPMTMSLGTRGLVVPELDEIMEARIPMVFGVPQSLIGTRTSYQNGGYANKRAEAQDFWRGTLIPLYKDLAGTTSIGLSPDFFGSYEVAFDLDDVWALREDMDAVAMRWSNLAGKGVASVQEARAKVGLPAQWDADAVFLQPSSSVPTLGDDYEEPEPPALPAPSGPGRPSTANDPEARSIWQRGVELREEFPSMTNEQIASRLSISVTTYWRYRTTFET